MSLCLCPWQRDLLDSRCTYTLEVKIVGGCFCILPPPLAHVRKGLWLHNGASGQVRISRSRDRRGVRKQSDVRGGLGSRPAQGFFPQQGPAALFYPGSSGIPGMLGPNPKGGGTENKHTHSNLNPNLGCTQALPPQQCVYISGTWLCERCRWRSMEHERGTAVCLCVCAVVDEVGELGYKSVLPFLTFSGAMLLLFVVFRFCAILLWTKNKK